MKIKAEIRGAVAMFPEFRFVRPVEWTIGKGENWAVAGPNGAGKTILADMLMRRIPVREGSVTINTLDGRSAYQAVKSIGFRDIYSLVDCSEAFYQQRWFSDAREATPLAGSLFGSEIPSGVEQLLMRFSLAGALEKRIVSLSSGELRKFQIIKALADDPDILIIDNPFVGLDEASRGELSLMLGELAGERGLQFILLVSDPADIPGWVNKVLPVRNMEVMKPVATAEFIERAGSDLFDTECLSGEQIPEPFSDPSDRYSTVARLEQVTVRYGDKVIVDQVDWDITAGQKWALLGQNGSGKSTILSLLYGDNPQAYANRITLFDRRRGTGESIWEIKRRIGYLNSEIHSFYLKDITALEVVLSGFYDTVGLYSAGTAEQTAEALRWLSIMGADDLAERKFVKLSFGQQRLIMLARTFVKRPRVVILDEPMHGLDAGKRAKVKSVLEHYCSHPDVTLIYVTHYPEEIPSCVTEIKSLPVPPGTRVAPATRK